jgi:hypothetical protein
MKLSALDWTFRIVVGGFVLIVAGLFAIGGIANLLDPRRQDLVHVVVRQADGALQVCADRVLHHCEITVGSTSGMDLEWRPAEIERADSCDTQVTRAYERCASDASAACMARHGVLTRATAARGDPRYRTIEAGQLRLQCDEGRKEGTFNVPMF